MHLQSSDPNAVLQSLIQRLGSPAVIDGTVAGTPPSYRATEEKGARAAPGALDGPWVHLRIRGQADDQSAILGSWQANLLVGDLREEMHAADSAHPLFGEAIKLIASDGHTVRTIDTNIGDIAYGQDFSTSSPAQIESAIKAGCQSIGVSVQAFTVFQGLDPAPAVVVRTADPDSYLQNVGANERAIFGDPTAYEGVYLEVQDSSGKPVMISSSSFRTGIGQTWIAGEPPTAYGG
jgi:hypothetical protein